MEENLESHLKQLEKKLKTDDINESRLQKNG